MLWQQVFVWSALVLLLSGLYCNLEQKVICRRESSSYRISPCRKPRSLRCRSDLSQYLLCSLQMTGTLQQNRQKKKLQLFQ